MLKFFRRLMVGGLSKRSRAQVRNSPSKLRIDVLEDRVVPATFNVNSLSDILSPTAGTVTLRSAIAAANATPGVNTINLTIPGDYKITLPGTPGEVDNAAGEFAILGSGGNLAINNTSNGTVTVDGANLSRVFDVNPTFSLAGIRVTAGGSKYSMAPTVTISGGGGTGATATAFISKGVVTSVTIVNPGSGYTSAPKITFSGGGGKGAAAVATLTAPNITVTMTGFAIDNGNAGPGIAANGSGGGIRVNSNASLTLDNMTITANSAAADGGGVAMSNVLGAPWTLALSGTTLSGNDAGAKGGGIYTDGAGTLTVTGGTITGNTSVLGGGGVDLDSAPNGQVFGVAITKSGSGFTSAPTVKFTGGGGSGAAGIATIAGGKITAVTITNPGSGYLTAPTVSFIGGRGVGAAGTASLALASAVATFTGATIKNNKALDSIGGGIANAGEGAVAVTGSSITGNTAGTTGGGYSDVNGQGTLTVSTSLISGNVSIGAGGGVFVGGPSASFTDSVVRNNISGAAGGGVFDGGGQLTVQDSTFSNNLASGDGGAIQLQTHGASSVTDSTIASNTALTSTGQANGGGIGTSTAFTGSLVLQSDTINGNSAAIGGGVAAAGSATSSITVENTIIAGNFGDDGTNGADAFGAFLDGGGNLIGVSGSGSGNTGFTAGTTQTGTVAAPLDPMLGALTANGGPTVGATGATASLGTEALLPGSPAIGNGVAGGPSTDERGFPLASKPDVGAFQFQNVALKVTVAAQNNPAAQGSTDTFTITIADTSATALPDDLSSLTVTLSPDFTNVSGPAGSTVSGNTITLSDIGAIAANGSVQFTVTATANTVTSKATVTAVVSSPDTTTTITTGKTSISIQ
jgi:hypothetical protein